MNKQDLILQYADYGFSPEETSKDLDIDIILVKSALFVTPIPNSEKPAKSRLRIYNGLHGGRSHIWDKNCKMYELLYKYGPYRINYAYKVYGLIKAANRLGTTASTLYVLKDHFGYDRLLPRNALDRIPYFPEEIRKKIDERDHGMCIRCHLTKAKWVYHKISHPGSVTDINNCATMCFWCHVRARQKYYTKMSMFKGMNTKEFGEWVHVNDPFK